jgi:hypothetical protein
VCQLVNQFKAKYTMELACVSDQIIQLLNLHSKNLAASNYDLGYYKSELDKLTSSMQAKEADHL